MHPTRRLPLLLLSMCALLIAGCGVGAISAPAVSSPGTVLKGILRGGQQPVSGAHIYLLEAGTSGYGGASVSLLNPAITGNSDAIGSYVVTSSTGSFSISGDYQCDAGGQVYLYALGGNTGGGTNSAAGIMALLGTCPASDTFANIPLVTMNEVSTVAAAYAVAGYATDAVHISSSGTPLAKTGIANAFANATNLADLPSGVALATTPGGNGTVPQAEIDTLADVLASCVNTANTSGGAASSTCSALFALATSNGTPTGTQPSDTATAAINIAHHPALNVSALYAMNGGSTSPFQPILAAAPNDWTVRLAFSSAYQGTNPETTNTLAVDGYGNVWAVGPFCGTVNPTPTTTPCATSSPIFEFTPLGVPTKAAGYLTTPYALYGPYSVAVDATSSNLWIADPGGYANTFNFNSPTSVVKFSISQSAGVLQLNSTNTPNLTTPYDAVLDATGNVWVGDNKGYLFQLNGSTGAVMNQVNDQYAYVCGCGPVFDFNGLAMGAGVQGNVWATNNTTGRVSVFTPAGAAVSGSPYEFDKQWYSTSVAIDAKGNAWFAGDPGIASLTASGTPAVGSPYIVSPLTYFGSALFGEGIAVDGDGNIWASSQESTVFEVNNAGVPLTTQAGFVAGTNIYPEAIAIDGSGDVWYNSTDTGVIYELVGAGAPVVTPIAYGVQTNQLGMRP